MLLSLMGAVPHLHQCALEAERRCHRVWAGVIGTFIDSYNHRVSSFLQLTTLYVAFIGTFGPKKLKDSFEV